MQIGFDVFGLAIAIMSEDIERTWSLLLGAHETLWTAAETSHGCFTLACVVSGFSSPQTSEKIVWVCVCVHVELQIYLYLIFKANKMKRVIMPL